MNIVPDYIYPNNLKFFLLNYLFFLESVTSEEVGSAMEVEFQLKNFLLLNILRQSLI